MLQQTNSNDVIIVVMKISIVGQISDYKCDGCFSPLDLKELLEGVSQDEPLEVEITSEGGSVFAGIQIANMLSRHSGLVSTHAVGLCASIATVILMAGKRISVDENCFCLIHLPWSYCEGNSNDMMKEIETLKKCEAAMMGYYRKHSKVDDELLSRYINDETWFLGTEFADVFDCEVIACDRRFDIAAKCDLTKFNKIDKRILDMTNEKTIVEEEENKECVSIDKDNETQKEEVNKEVQNQETPVEDEETKEDVSTDKNTEEPKEDEEVLNKDEVLAKFAEYEKKIEELKEYIKELEKENFYLMNERADDDLPNELTESKKPDEDKEEMVTKKECEKRVSGMQASMQKHINDFANQLKVKDEELISARSEITRLNNDLETSNNELSSIKAELEKTASALVEKTNKLDALNAGVLAKPEQVVDWRNLKGKEFWNFLKQHPEIKNAK